jgi:hypothetical protein
MARNSEFTGAAFNTRGVNVRGFKPTSVLDNIMPTGLGVGAADKARLLPGGGRLASFNGASQDTWNKKSWLDEPRKVIV